MWCSVCGILCRLLSLSNAHILLCHLIDLLYLISPNTECQLWNILLPHRPGNMGHIYRNFLVFHRGIGQMWNNHNYFYIRLILQKFIILAIITVIHELMMCCFQSTIIIIMNPSLIAISLAQQESWKPEVETTVWTNLTGEFSWGQGKLKRDPEAWVSGQDRWRTPKQAGNPAGNVRMVGKRLRTSELR